MNKKALMLTFSLLAVVMLATPLVGTAQACRHWRWRPRRTCLDYTAVVQPGTHIPFPGYPKYWPSEENPEIVFIKLTENMTGYKVIIGDTTYVKDTDFTYDGIMWVIIPVDEPYMYLTVRYRITFLTASGIDGALKMWARFKYWPATVTFEGGAWGYGTGDLRGVIVKATAGDPIVDPDYGPALTHVGTVCGWPT